MKPLIPLLASLLVLLPAIGFAQTGPSAKTAPAPAAASSGYARTAGGTICTTAPRTEWFPEDEMRLLAQHRGYRIKTFKVANNSCYEVYGFDRHGRIVEAYFNPVTTRLVRENIAR